jgi:hypothetical protein
MLLRNMTLSVAALAAFCGVAVSTEVGALAFLAPGRVMAESLFPHQPGTYYAHGSSPDDAIVAYLAQKTAENYSNALWCSIAFWVLVAILVPFAVTRTLSRRAPNTSCMDSSGK